MDDKYTDDMPRGTNSFQQAKIKIKTRLGSNYKTVMICKLSFLFSRCKLGISVRTAPVSKFIG